MGLSCNAYKIQQTKDKVDIAIFVDSICLLQIQVITVVFITNIDRPICGGLVLMIPSAFHSHMALPVYSVPKAD